MKCIHGWRGMAFTTAPFHTDRPGYHLLLERVPAWVCEQCREPYFESPEVDAFGMRSKFSTVRPAALPPRRPEPRDRTPDLCAPVILLHAARTRLRQRGGHPRLCNTWAGPAG